MPYVSRRFVALLLLPLLLLAACSDGDDDGDDATASSTTTSSTSSTSTTIATLDADEVDADASPYCATWAEIRELGGPPLDGATEEERAADRKAHYAKLVPLAERLAEQADDEIAESVEFALAQVREVAETGSDEPFSRKGAQQHQQRLAAYAQEHCAA